MKAVIYYFSGTGNSLWLAEKAAERLNGKIPLVKINRNIVQNDSHHSEAEIIGIVCPVYYADLPLMVRDFIRQGKWKNDQKVFFIFNYGGSIGVTHQTAQKILRDSGGKTAGFLSVQMPQNAFNKPLLVQRKILRKADQTVMKFNRELFSRKNLFRISTNPLFDRIQLLFVPLMKLLFRKYFKKFSEDVNQPFDEVLIRKADFYYTVDQKLCNRCGVCEKICPAQNIRLTGHGPEWLHKCENCLACVHWCPKSALTLPIMEKGYHYIHPEIRLKDMI